jgi:hypothetical protein
MPIKRNICTLTGNKRTNKRSPTDTVGARLCIYRGTMQISMEKSQKIIIGCEAVGTIGAVAQNLNYKCAKIDKNEWHFFAKNSIEL